MTEDTASPDSGVADMVGVSGEATSGATTMAAAMTWAGEDRDRWAGEEGAVGATPGPVEEDVGREAEVEEGRCVADLEGEAGELEEGGGGRTRNDSDTQQIYLVKRYVYT